MKSFRGTFVLAILVAGLLGYAYYDYLQGEKQAADKAEKERILAFKPEDITAVKVIKPLETMSLERSGDQWKMTQPLIDDVEAETMRSYLDSISMEKGGDLAKPASGAYNWAEYNLDIPGAKIELKKADGSTTELVVSRLAAFDGSYFVRLGDRLILGGSNWGNLIAKTASQFRNKKVLRKSGEVETLTIETNSKDLKDKVVLTQGKPGEWKLQGVSFPVSKDAVEKYLDHLKDIRALDYLSDKADAANLKKNGLQAPEVKVRLTFAKSDPKIEDWVISVAAEKNGASIATSNAVAEIFKLSSYDAGQLNRGKMDFRDGKEPFRLAVDQVREIHIKTKGGERVIKKDGDTWTLAGSKPDEEVSTESLESLMTTVSALQAKEFYPAGQAIGTVGSMVNFRDGAGKLLLEISAGDDVTPSKGKSKGQSLRYVKTNLTKDVLAVASNDWNGIPLESVVRTKSPAVVDSSKQK